MNKLKNKLFGAKPNSQDRSGETIQKLRNMEELLEKKQSFLEKKIEDELQIARKNGLKNKRAALQALMRKKRYEKQLQQIDGTLTTLELQREALEMAHSNTAVLKTMTEASKALKTANEHLYLKIKQKILKVDTVHDMMDDIAEQQDVAKEIADAISNPIAFSTDVDADELEKELEELTQEELDRELLAIDPVVTEERQDSDKNDPKLAEAAAANSQNKAGRKNSDEDDKVLKELEQWGLS